MVKTAQEKEQRRGPITPSLRRIKARSQNGHGEEKGYEATLSQKGERPEPNKLLTSGGRGPLARGRRRRKGKESWTQEKTTAGGEESLYFLREGERRSLKGGRRAFMFLRGGGGGRRSLISFERRKSVLRKRRRALP